MKMLLLAVMVLPCLSIAQDVAMNNTVIPSTLTSPSVTNIETEVRELESREVGLSSILVRGTITIRSRGKPDVSLNAVVFTDGTSTRIKIDFGSISIIDYVQKDNDLTLYLPRKDALFSGSKDDVSKLKSWLSLLSSDLSGYSLVFPSAWDANAAQRRYIREKNTMVVFSVNDNIVNVHKKIAFVRDNSRLTIGNIYKYDENGELCGLISFDDYRVINSSLIPHKISFSVSDDSSVTFNFEEVLLNQSATPAVFEIKPSQETPLKKLNFSEWNKRDWLSP